MPLKNFPVSGGRPEALFVVLVVLLCVLSLSGGSSRADVLGQVLSRAAAFGALGIVAMIARVDLRAIGPVRWLILSIVFLPAIQLIPLPPLIWSHLTGRELFVDPSVSEGRWLPISISPGATINSLFSLVVPVVVIIIASTLNEQARKWSVGIILGAVIFSIILGILQFSGAGFSNPLVNDSRGAVSGSFSNRNHFAVVLAIGLIVAPVWAFIRRDGLTWRVPCAIGIVLLAALMILASGSRSGMAIGAFSLILGPLAVREHLIRIFRGKSKSLLIFSVIVFLVAILSLLLASTLLGRAVSIDRAMTLDIEEDMRGLGLPTVLSIVYQSFPYGVGMGTFDPAFRNFEPDQFLQLFYFNHAHNDLIELVLEAGIVGLVILTGALWWWVKASWVVWRRPLASTVHMSGRLGSVVILLVLVASATDYPARTPLVMAIIAMAACWLAWGEQAARSAESLPLADR